MGYVRHPIVTEKSFLSAVIDLCKVYGYEYYHTWKSIHSPKGFPDLVMVNPSKKKLVIAELKTDNGKITKFQEDWIQWLKDCGVEAQVWRPKDWDKIVEILSK
jgi:hypothetical protein